MDDGITYPEWAPISVDVPRRAPLHTLAPQGRGTAAIESLSSYVSRLAALYGVSTFTLFEVLAELRPATAQNCPARRPWPRWFNLDGSGWMARLEHFSGQSGLASLTMKRWLPVIRYFQLLRKNRAWCPRCLSEWSETGAGVYEPLLWAIACVSACVRHQCPLSTRCPACRQELPIRWSVHAANRCSRCLADLGQARADDRPGAHWTLRLWCAEQAGLLMTAEDIPYPDKARLAESLYERWKEAGAQALRRRAEPVPGEWSFWLSIGDRASATETDARWTWLYPSCRTHRLELFTALSFCCRRSILELLRAEESDHVHFEDT
jgi:hypothetical protein